ncbi:MAG: flagellin [Desulfobulbaceae bacterium]|nr:flagellin [Desulfobulbaceae bacterium]
MTFSINNNTSGLFSSKELQQTQQKLLASIGRLSSGKRLNQAADDAAGMVIADSLGSQARGYGMSIRNANDAISIAQVADGALGQASELISSIRAQALQAANGSQSPESRQALQANIQKTIGQLDTLAKNTTYNGQQLLSGGFTDKNFQVGPSANESTTFSLGSIQSKDLGDKKIGSLSEVNVLTDQGAQTAMEIADAAMTQVDRMRADVGSRQNQLASTISNLSTSRINTLAAESTIRDLDIAEESANFATMESLYKAQIFAATQANSNKKNVMNLLQGQF